MNFRVKMVVHKDPMDDDTPIRDRAILALADDAIRTFGQLELLCGAADPLWAMNAEEFSGLLDSALRELIDEGKVLLVAKRPELCFRRGTALDEIVKGIDAGS